MASEILRREMEPLGVKVQTVVTGAVKTKIFDNAQVDPLPDESVYKAAEKEIQTRMVGADVFTASAAEDFARGLVHDAIARKTGHTYRGKFASTIRICRALLPEWVVDVLTSQGMGLEKVKESAAGLNKH